MKLRPSSTCRDGAVIVQTWRWVRWVYGKFISKAAMHAYIHKPCMRTGIKQNELQGTCAWKRREYELLSW